MQLIEKIAPFYILFILLEFFYSLVTKQKVYSFSDSIADMATGTMSRLLDVLILIFSYVIYEGLRNSLGNPFGIQMDFSSPFEISNSFPFISVQVFPFWSWLILFLLADLVFYCYHRASHEINFFWASHVVHHSSEEFNYSVALRQTLFRNLFYILFGLPLTILNISWESLIIADALNRTYQFWTHTRLVPRLPAWFEFIFVTPSHHRVHHAVNPEYIDKNYSGFLIIWDRLFGTFEEEKAEPVYGITKKLNTYNPVLANFHVYKDILTKLLSPIKFSEKLGYTFRYPGWEPSQTERIFLPVSPRVNQDYPISTKSKVLILLYFILLVISSLLFIRLSLGLTIYLKAIFILGFILLFGILGKILDNKALYSRPEESK